ncbi:MAG TPA: alpha-mannosidase [Firmicutes bacterium]|nr:alpha-mannosidase [Bacillota bacterium]
MHFKNGFKDQNSERYMLATRVKKLIARLRAEYWYDASFHPGPFQKKEGLIPFEELDRADGAPWVPFDGTKEKWGGENRNVWFRHRFTLPPEMAGRPVTYAAALTENGGWYWGAPQILAYVNGKPATGMDVNHRDILLTGCAKGGEEYTVDLCAFTDRFFYRGQVEMNMTVNAVNTAVQQLYYDLEVPFEVADALPDGDTRRLDILRYLNDAVSLVDYRLPRGEAFNQTVQAAIDYLQQEFYGKFCGHEDCTVTCVGHTHIDTAWLWTLEQTRKKVARSFSTALSLLDRYEDFPFMASQPQQYVYLKEALPESYEKLRAYVHSGRWEPEGAMWIEADTNIPCGESLVRQILYGKRFFRDEFGRDTRILWLPDVFGYSGALPQILKKSGVDYFMTTKISWNEYNKLPYDTFQWEGIDGSRVLTHFICTQHCGEPETEYLTTYNGYLGVPYVIGTWERYQQKDLNRDVLFSFGYGDGGGGPNAEMMEHARRMAKGIPGCPRVKLDTPLHYFEKLEREVGGNKRLPVWAGELYFEYHRGTYTSIAKIKKNMRRGEILLMDAELFGVAAGLLGAPARPVRELDEAWHLLMLNQFHDILPGSSIREVYEDSDRQFAAIRQAGSAALDGALDDIAARVELAGDALVVFNATSWQRDSLAYFDADGDDFAILDGQEALPWQRIEDGRAAFTAKGIPAKGYKAFRLVRQPREEAAPLAVINGRRIETPEFRLELDENGNIASLFSKAAEREFVLDSPMNRLIALEDVPPNDDAWNINAYINEKTWAIDGLDGFAAVENGPARCVVRLQRHFLDSRIEQDLILAAGVPRIDVRTRIDWKEKDILLKADFPFPVNARHAAFDIQFGNVERSTTENTSWDFAQFEVCAQRWADLSEDGFGLSILNDCKYGYDVKHGHLRLTLLKSAVYPNPDADKEFHEFTYAIYPHAEGWRQADTVRQAAFLNCPAYVRAEAAHPGDLPAAWSLVSCSAPNVVVDAVKPAEDGDGVIVRLYECFNRTTDARLTFGRAPREALACDLMENAEGSLPLDGDGLPVRLKPYEIQTLRLRF